jgi:alkanesulfonate monooxygenase SsuD/methylene tetrahydromethanopterin reductase-like flavin-dependent oxidoreductase (luciferase family)
MQFGIFDHLDRNDLDLKAFYANRLELVEAYDRLGFYCYHIAEHHMTPLGLAPSPSVFLSAVAQRTSRLRFGPLVYTLPMHHPLRLIEEICMLDQLSGGRVQIGVGKGISPFETRYYGIDPETRQARFEEALEVLLRGLNTKTLSFQGQYYNYDDVPMEVVPLQKPHPPIWMGVSSPSAAISAARRSYNFVSLSTSSQARLQTDAYRDAREHSGGATDEGQFMGLGRFVIVAPTDDEALAIARRVYPMWHAHFHHLYNAHGTTPVLGERPPDFDLIKDGGRGIAGSPETVARMIKEQSLAAGTNYFVGQFAFGDLGQAEALRSINLFATEVMPQVREELDRTMETAG